MDDSAKPVDNRYKDASSKLLYYIRMQGASLELKVMNLEGKRIEPAERHIIMEFSKAARLRLLKFINRVAWDKVTKGVFVTLTYPDEMIERTKEERTKDRSRFIRDAERHLNQQITGIWRVEWKPRLTGKHVGRYAPHWHFILTNVTWFHRKKVRSIWRAILKADGPLSTHVRALKDGKMCAAYTAKYAAKKPAFDTLDILSKLNTDGRHYGFFRKGLIPMAETEWIMNPTPEQVAWLISWGVETLPWLREHYHETFTLLGAKAKSAFERIRKLGLATRCRPVYDDSIKGGRG
jgi:hypothetical protein